MTDDTAGRLTAFAGITPSHPSGGSFLNPVAKALVDEAAARINSDADAIASLRRERDEADQALVDRYRDPKSGVFNFPTDVAAIVRRLDAAEAQVAKLTETMTEVRADLYREFGTLDGDVNEIVRKIDAALQKDKT